MSGLFSNHDQTTTVRHAPIVTKVVDDPDGTRFEIREGDKVIVGGTCANRALALKLISAYWRHEVDSDRYRRREEGGAA